MNNDDPIAFFITWTVYGTFLQGDVRLEEATKRGTTPDAKADDLEA